MMINPLYADKPCSRFSCASPTITIDVTFKIVKS